MASMGAQLLNLFVKLAIFDDDEPTQHPRKKSPDWDRQFEGVVTGNELTRRIDVAPGTTETVASTTRTLSQDATTDYSVTQPDPDENIFRYRWVGGTNPVLRTARTPGHDDTTEFTITKSGQLVRFTATAGTIPDFVAGGVVVGDILNIEDSTPADTSPFNELNQGQRTIVAVSATYVEVLNTDGVAEVVTLGTRTDTLPVFSVYSSGPVQVSDEVRITSTVFSILNRGSFQVQKVTADYFDVLNASPGVTESPSAIGSADGLVFYSSLWKWLYLETDQKISVRLNGDSTDRNEVEPIVTADRNQVGVLLKRGGIYSVQVYNPGLQNADVRLVLAE